MCHTDVVMGLKGRARGLGSIGKGEELSTMRI